MSVTPDAGTSQPSAAFPPVQFPKIAPEATNQVTIENAEIVVAGTPTIDQGANSSAEPDNPSKLHNTYGLLVEDDADMVGHVAYALYKREKLKFLESIRSKRSRPATGPEIETFIESCNLDTRIKAYRAEATLLLERFSEAVLNETIPEIERENRAEIIEALKQRGSWYAAISQNFLANVLVIALGALIAIVIYGTRIGFPALLGDIFGYNVTEKTE